MGKQDRNRIKQKGAIRLEQAKRQDENVLEQPNGSGWRRRLEFYLRMVRRGMVDDRKYLALVCLVAWLSSAQSLGTIAANTWGGEPWWGKATVMILLTSLAIGLYLHSCATDDVVITGNVNMPAGLLHREDHNIQVMNKSTGKAVTLAVFAILDSTLKNQDLFLVVQFCSSFFVFIVHLLVIFNIHEDIDITGGFLSAAFVLVYEKTTLLWEGLTLVIMLIAFSNYKSLLFEGIN